MKKKVVLLLCLVVGVSSSACTKKQSSIETEIITDNYTYETNSDDINTVNQDVLDGWRLVDYYIDENNESKPFYIPMYHDDTYVIHSIPYADNNNDDGAKNKLRPDGTKFHKYSGDLFSSYFSQPIFEDNKFVGMTKLNELYNTMDGFIFGSTGYSDETIVNIEDSHSKKVSHYTGKADIYAISVALYEDFFSWTTDINMYVYGVPTDFYESYLGNDNIYSTDDYLNYTSEVTEEYNNFDLILSNSFGESGIFYIDFTDLNDTNKYKDYYVRFENEGNEICFYEIHGNYGYNITNQSEYEAWKEKNKDKFLN